MSVPFRAVLLGLVLLGLGTVPTTARDWHGGPGTVAPGSVADYVTITDTRPDGDFVVVWWLSSQLMADGPSPTLTAQLSRYVVIATVHGSRGEGGVSFESDTQPAPADTDGTALKPVAEADIPAEIKGLITMTKLAMMQGFQKRAEAMSNPVAKASMTEAANNVRFWVFDAGAIAACKPGKLSVDFVKETYTFDLPLPGCPVPV